VEIALRGWMQTQKPISTATELLKCQKGTNASLCSGIMLKNDDTSMEEVRNIQLNNYFLFDFYDPGNLTC
jgi:hypothetical protein